MDGKFRAAHGDGDDRDPDRWLVMRTEPVLPKGIIQRVRGIDGERYLLFKWDPDPARRMLVGVHELLEKTPTSCSMPAQTPTWPRSLAARNTRGRWTLSNHRLDPLRGLS